MAGIPDLLDCNPGIRATGFTVFVAIEPVADKRGAVFIPDSVRDKEAIVQIRGRIVSVGPVAFDYADFPEGTAPKVGDAITFAKLAGLQFDGKDGRKYRAILDKDVFGIIDEEPEGLPIMPELLEIRGEV